MARICFNLRDTGACRFGARCRFSHDLPSLPNAPTTSSGPTHQGVETSDTKSVLRRWAAWMPKSQDPRYLHETEVTSVDLTRFFTQGWECVSGNDPDISQQIIKGLASNPGLHMIRSLVNSLGDTLPEKARQRRLMSCVVPFLQIISHANVLYSFVLENHLETIYNYLFGPSGRRSVTLFAFCASVLPDLADDTDDLVGKSIPETFDAVVAVLQKVFELNQTAQIVESFTSIVETLSAVLPERSQSQDAWQNMTKIRRRLGLGSLMPEQQSRPTTTSRYRPVFQLTQDGPGSLSKHGARHDNDHEHIRDIKVLPTGEEILADRLEYLPLLDSRTHHLPGMAGLVDRQFRLLREDAIGPLRDEIRREFERLAESQAQFVVKPDQRAKRSNHGVKTLIYHNVHLSKWDVDRSKGLRLVIQFDQPQALHGKNRKERERWWQDRKALQLDSLICLVAADGQAIFLSVSDPKPTPPRRTQTRNEEDEEDQNLEDIAREQEYQQKLKECPSLDADAQRAQLMPRLVDGTTEQVSWTTQKLAMTSLRMSLVEFPGTLLPAFEPTLKALQRISTKLDMPFTNMIAPDVQVPEEVVMPPPAYASVPGFAYKIETAPNEPPLTFTPGRAFDMHRLRQLSQLDEAQQDSFIHALSSALAMIQGPPGTGKSYTGVELIKTMLRVRETAKLGPILCVCYTNHALDQLLEHLIGDGITQIIRVGSQSKSEVLENLSLWQVAQATPPTKHEKQEKWRINTAINTAVGDIRECLSNMSSQNTWANIQNYLQNEEPDRFFELEAFDGQFDEDGFKVVRNRRMDPLEQWIASASQQSTVNRSLGELRDAPLHHMSAHERTTISLYWHQCAKDHELRTLLEGFEALHKAKSELDSCRQEVNLRCMLQAHVIGVTTSGLARNLEVLRRLNAKVLVCEEAGEVLEAHSLTILLPSIEHAIFIGDHEQLRPQINNYDLKHDNPQGKKYSLDISLFERLVRPQAGHLRVPYATLRTQRRMDPSIANLMRATLYPELEDHDTVTSYPQVDGMRKRLFWLDHQVKEDAKNKEIMSVTAPFSTTNAWEVEMVEALVSHLVRQTTYEAGDIAVLTPYLGQLRRIKERLASSFEIVLSEQDEVELDLEHTRQGETAQSWRPQLRKTTLLKTLRLSTVDNFQGEEAKVVVISLVRCNEERKCGFLEISNRINVLLSRAKHGMYIIGSAGTASPVEMWADVLTELKAGGNVGTKLPLRCPRHDNILIEVSQPDDFTIFSPEGGCNQRCGSRLPCGHACHNKCHAESLHNAVHCHERCLKVKKSCDHPCPKECGDPCDKYCQVTVSNIRLPCGHIAEFLKCHQAQAFERITCKKLVKTTMKDCNHDIQVPCHELRFNDDLQCSATCGAPLPCGHDCKLDCHVCQLRIDRRVVEVNHGPCTSICGRGFTTCNHSCTSVCHGEVPCPSCEQPCGVRCSHSRCPKKCSEPCVPCVENCTWSCPHRGACPLPCAVPCDLVPCSLRCSKRLSCGHQCPSACGEICPESKYCQQCANDPVKEMMVDYIMGTTYAETNLDENPCIVPSCGHILTVESMDGMMGMSDYYDTSLDGTFTSLKSMSVPFSETKVKNCGTCRRPLRDINRYSRIVRRAWIDQATKKFIVWANRDFLSLVSEVAMLENEAEDDSERLLIQLTDSRTPMIQNRPATIRLEQSTANIIKNLRSHLNKYHRLKPFFTLQQKIQAHLKAVDEAEQPFGRIRDLTQSVRITQGLTTDIGSGADVLQVRNRLLATVLLLRIDFAILQLFSSIHRRPQFGTETTADLKINLQAYRQLCQTLETDAKARSQPACIVEAALYLARFVTLERNLSPEATETSFAPLVDASRSKLTEARLLCAAHPGQTRGLPTEIHAAERMLRDRTFYEAVTNEEKAAVYAAMATEFLGTGHWYYCVNGHPFTVGECGMPMQTSRCPQCGETVGGQSHQPAEGVQHAGDLEEQMMRLRVGR